MLERVWNSHLCYRVRKWLDGIIYEYSFVKPSLFVVCYMPSPPVQKIHPCSDTTLSTSNLQAHLL